jgi:hypothetical protein
MPAADRSSPPLEMSDLRDALSRYGQQQAQLVARNPKMLKATFDLLKAVQSADAIGGVSALTSGSSAAAKMTGASASVKTGAQSASLVMSSFKISMGLAKVSKLSSPGAVAVFVGASTLQKTGLAVSMAGGDSERAACVGALMELAGSATVTAITAPTGILLALSLASLTASTYNAYLACNGADH